MAIWRSFIAEKAMPLGNHLLLKKRWQFGYVLLLNIRWVEIWQHTFAKFLRAIWGQPIAQYLLVILGTSYHLNSNNRVNIVAFIRLEGVNCVSHMFLLF
jgi:hypothetical protein